MRVEGHKPLQSGFHKDARGRLPGQLIGHSGRLESFRSDRAIPRNTEMGMRHFVWKLR